MTHVIFKNKFLMAKMLFSTNALAKLLERNKCYRHEFPNVLSYSWGHGSGPHKLAVSLWHIIKVTCTTLFILPLVSSILYPILPVFSPFLSTKIFNNFTVYKMKSGSLKSSELWEFLPETSASPDWLLLCPPVLP